MRAGVMYSAWLSHRWVLLCGINNTEQVSNYEVLLLVPLRCSPLKNVTQLLFLAKVCVEFKHF
jgi:hypothetical protein